MRGQESKVASNKCGRRRNNKNKVPSWQESDGFIGPVNSQTTPPNIVVIIYKGWRIFTAKRSGTLRFSSASLSLFWF